MALNGEQLWWHDAKFDDNMTSITYTLFVYNYQVRIVLDLGYWG
jgi:hypothetical protein